MHPILLALALLAAPLFAETPRQPWPDDYQPQPCAIEDTCVTFSRSGFLSQAVRTRGITSLETGWLTAHWEEMHSALAPSCAKAAACFAAPGATFTFCNDSVLPEMRATCDRFPAGSKDRNQCEAFVEAFAVGRDQRSPDWWKKTQECVKAAGPQSPRTYQPVVWTEPATIPPDYKGMVTFYALDPETRLPVEARVTIEGQKIYSPTAASGLPTTYYGFNWPVKLKRVANADGHYDVAPPTVTVSSEWYPAVTLPMPVALSSMTVEMTPSIDKLRSGKNRVIFTARDAATGKPVEARVMLGDLVVGDANQPVTIDIPRGRRRPEIWATSLFGLHSDVVVVRAK